jgi:hypothetical protein
MTQSTNNNDLRKACFEWLKPTGPAIAATLTFRPSLEVMSDSGIVRHRLTERDAQAAVANFLRRLDAAAYGKEAIRRGRRLGAIAIREGGTSRHDKHLHYHLQLQVPDHETLYGWRVVAADAWRKLRWASPKQNVFRDVTDEGWISYILKLRDKPNFIDAVDVENIRIN